MKVWQFILHYLLKIIIIIYDFIWWGGEMLWQKYVTGVKKV